MKTMKSRFEIFKESLKGGMGSGGECSQYQRPVYLQQIRQEALAAQIPIIREETEDLLRFLLRVLSPERILEIGTGTGYSALFMAEQCPRLQYLLSYESSTKRFAKAKELVEVAGRSDVIHLKNQDAVKGLESPMEQRFDFVFLDGAKAQNHAFLRLTAPLLRQGGIIAVDNALFDGRIMESRFALRRRDRTIHSRLRDFLREVYENPAYTCDLLQCGDGMLLITKNESSR